MLYRKPSAQTAMVMSSPLPLRAAPVDGADRGFRLGPTLRTAAKSCVPSKAAPGGGQALKIERGGIEAHAGCKNGSRMRVFIIL